MSRLLVLVVAAFIVSGCATVAPKYQPSMENVSALRADRTAQVRVGAFTAGGEDANKINDLTIRGGSFVSPYGGSYVEYLREALRQELSLAGMLNDNADVEVSGVLLKNELDASGINVAYAVVGARLTVRNKGAVRYDSEKSVRHEWESSFSGYTAHSRALQNYAIAVQKLLASFFNDPDLLRALKE